MTNRPSICIVASELAYLFKTGGIGTCNWRLACLLAQHGWNVHILYCRPIEDAQKFQTVSEELTRIGCSISLLDQAESTEEFDLDVCNRSGGHLELSERVRHGLEQLHQQHRFDLIEFGEYNALGFRSIQAKRAGISFWDVGLIVKLHGASRWVLSANYRVVSRIDELSVDYCERYAFENADFQVAPSQYMLAHVKSIGWQLRDALRVVSYAYPDAPPEQSSSTKTAPRVSSPDESLRATLPPEIVFFGRLETRKGLELFVDAVRELDPALAVTFLGKEGVVSRRVPAVSLVKQRLRGRRIAFLTDLDQAQAIDYLLSGNKLAVIPSLTDNLPNTVIECAVNGIPMIASRVGGIPEVLKGTIPEQNLLFEPTSADLKRCIKRYLSLPTDERNAIHQAVQAAADPYTNNARVVESYQEILATKKDEISSSSLQNLDSNSPVNVAVICGSRLERLPETLISLSGQTHAGIQVSVFVADPSNPESVRILKEQRAQYPQFKFTQTEECDFASQANIALHSSSSGEFFMLVRPPATATARAVEVLAHALWHNPRISAFSCYQLDRVSNLNSTKEKHSTAFRPVGGPDAIANLENVYGTFGMFRREHLRNVGGFEPGFEVEFAFWVACMKLIANGCEVDVVPEHLCSSNSDAENVPNQRAYHACHRVLKKLDSVSAEIANKDRVERLYLAIKRQLNVQASNIRHLAGLNVDICRVCGTLHSQFLANRVVDKVFAIISRLPSNRY